MHCSSFPCTCVWNVFMSRLWSLVILLCSKSFILLNVLLQLLCMAVTHCRNLGCGRISQWRHRHAWLTPEQRHPFCLSQGSSCLSLGLLRQGTLVASDQPTIKAFGTESLWALSRSSRVVAKGWDLSRGRRHVGRQEVPAWKEIRDDLHRTLKTVSGVAWRINAKPGVDGRSRCWIRWPGWRWWGGWWEGRREWHVKASSYHSNRSIQEIKPVFLLIVLFFGLW